MTDARDRKRTVRNLVIFTILIIGLGWLASNVGALIGATSPEEDPGQLLWIAAPVGISLLLRAFGGDGWKDLGIKPNLKERGMWYGIGILVYPVSVALIVASGLLFGAISIDKGVASPVSVFIQTWITYLIPDIVLNILEEFGFRGYLAPKVYSLGLNVWVAHAVVGLIWGAWHLPFLRAITPYTSESLVTLVPRFLLGTIAASLVHGEIRLATGSVWPAVLTQIAGGPIVAAVVMSGLFSIRPASGFLFLPVVESLLMVVLFGLVGVVLHRLRTQGSSPNP